MAKTVDTFRALADLLDEPEVLAQVAVRHAGEQAERIAKLEQLCRDMYERIQVRDNDVAKNFGWSKQACLFSDRMAALGLLDGSKE